MDVFRPFTKRPHPKKTAGIMLGLSDKGSLARKALDGAVSFEFIQRPSGRHPAHPESFRQLVFRRNGIGEGARRDAMDQELLDGFVFGSFWRH